MPKLFGLTTWWLSLIFGLAEEAQTNPFSIRLWSPSSKMFPFNVAALIFTFVAAKVSTFGAPSLADVMPLSHKPRPKVAAFNRLKFSFS